MNEAASRLQADREALVIELQKAGFVFKRGNECCCGFHDDANPSAGIYEKDGVWRVKCHGCNFIGDIFDVMDKAGGKSCGDSLSAFIFNASKPQPAPKPVKRYESIKAMEATIRGLEDTTPYTNPDTNHVDMVVFRYNKDGSKKFLQGHQNGNGFIFQAPPKPWPICNRIRIKESDNVIVVEGEKCVKSLAKIGIVATTSPGGAGKAQYADWTPLAGKNVTLWPDNDDKGISHMQDVRLILESMEPKSVIGWVDPTQLQLPEKGDVADLLDDMGNATKQNKIDAIMDIVADSKPSNPASRLRDNIEKIISGEIESIDWPWPSFTNLTQSLVPGSVTLVCGSAGSTKSFMMLQAAIFWYCKGYKIALYELEDDLEYHLRRLLSQLEENSSLMDLKWIRANPDVSRSAHEKHTDLLNGLGDRIWTAPDAVITLDHLAEWVKARAEDGNRIIVVDPVTAAEPGNQPWVADYNFLFSVKSVVRKCGASLVLVTHPKKGRQKQAGLDDLAGGAGYARFTHTIAWVDAHPELVTVKLNSSMGRYDGQCNRTVHLFKTRFSKGVGLSIGNIFSSETLLTAEQGVIVKEK